MAGLARIPYEAEWWGKNRDRLLAANVATLFFQRVLDEAKAQHLISDEYFTVDGMLLEAWAGLKSLKKVGADDDPPPSDDPGNPTANFHGETHTNVCIYLIKEHRSLSGLLRILSGTSASR
jgi:hypothetical protein